MIDELVREGERFRCFQRRGQGHFVTTASTAELKIVPNMAVYAATKNAVRTVMEGCQESTDGAVRSLRRPNQQ